MTDCMSPERRSEIMRRIGSRNTKPELALRKALHAIGYRYRLHAAGLPGKPDIVLPRYSTAIQVRGCFWHGHTCSAGRVPASKQDYWLPKLAGNKRRDARNDRALRLQGWHLLVVWECQIGSAKKLQRQVKRIVGFLSRVLELRN